MPDFNVRSDSVNVEQIMEQIRARIREKRGVDYTEQQIRELAAVKLEKFLDPRGVRSDLLEQFRKAQPAYQPPELPNYAFEGDTLFASTRAPVRWLRKLLNPILKIFFNPNPLIQALNIQSRLNTMYGEREARREATRRAFDQLQYELMHNMVIETTRLSIEVKNLKMRVESMTGRLEFNERRARALESVVAYKPSSEDRIESPVPPPAAAPRESSPVPSTGFTPREPQPRPDVNRGTMTPAQDHSGGGQQQSAPQGQGPAGEGPGQRSRRRRRRRGRRGGGGTAQSLMGGQPQGQAPAGEPPVGPSSGSGETAARPSDSQVGPGFSSGATPAATNAPPVGPSFSSGETAAGPGETSAAREPRSDPDAGSGQDDPQ